MAMMSQYQAFPITKHTVQGVATDFDMTTVKYNLVRFLEDGDITYNDGKSPYTFTGFKAGDDIVISGDAQTLTSTGNILVS